MKILKIDICNIASIRQAQIDFSSQPLNDAPLMLITGETGAGKSTILDAICLAFYGNAPRLASLKNTKVEGTQAASITSPLQLVRRNSSKAYCSVLFENNAGKRYIARWDVIYGVRGQNKGMPKKAEHALYDENNNFLFNISKETAKEPNELSASEYVGLTFDQFKRTTLLAQGEFNKFLIGDAKEKCNILERLIGAEKFQQYGLRINELYKQAKQDFEIQDKITGQIKLLSESELAALKVNQEKTKKILDRLNIQNEELNSIAKWFEIDDNNKKSLERAKTSMEEALNAAKSQYISDIKIIVSRWKRLQPIREIDGKIHDLQTQITKYTTHKANLNSTCESIYSTLISLKKELQESLANSSEINTKLENYTDRQLHIFANAQVVLDRLSNYDNALSQFEEAVRAEEFANANYNEAIKGSSALSLSDITSLKSKLIAYIDDINLLTQMERYNSTHRKVKKAQDEYTKAMSDFETARLRYDKVALGTKDVVKSLRAQLSPGDDCPVCGQKIRQIVLDSTFEDILKPLKDELISFKENLDNKFKACNSLEIEAKAILKILPDPLPPFDELKLRIEASGKELGVNLEKAKERLEKTIEDEKCIIQSQKLLNDWNEARTKKENKAEAYNRAAQKLSEFIEIGSHFSTQDTINTLTAQKTAYDALIRDKDLNATRQKELNQLITLLEEALTAARHPLPDETSATLPNIKPIRQEDIKRITTRFTTEYTTVCKLLAEYSQKLKDEQSLKDDVISSLEVADKPFASDPTLGKTEKEINELESQIQNIALNLSKTEGAYLNAKNVHDEHLKQKPDSDLNPQIIAEKQPCVVKQISENEQLLGQFTSQLQADREARRKHQDALASLEKLKAVYADWDTLNDLFGTDKFKMYVCSQILSHMLDEANYYYSLFQDRYSLKINDDSFEILVLDRTLNQTRVFSSLSGGETFIVSLSLALGLAALNNVRNTCDTLFIDEGFGTLSSNCLDAVMDHLDRLRKMEKRRVVIISHVESIRERIPVQIRVARSGSYSQIHINTDGSNTSD